MDLRLSDGVLGVGHVDWSIGDVDDCRREMKVRSQANPAMNKYRPDKSTRTTCHQAGLILIRRAAGRSHVSCRRRIRSV